MTLGIVFALLGSLSFAANSVTMRRGISRAAASQGLYVTVFLGLLLFIVASLISTQLFDIGTVSSRDWGFLLAGGLVHLLGGRYCNYRAMGAMGANRAQPVVGTSTLFSIIIAIVWLGEGIDLLKGIGIVLVMVGPALVAPRRKSAPQTVPAGASGTAPAGTVRAEIKPFNPRIKEGYFFGVMAAMLWGAGPVLMRAGVESNGLGVLGGTIAYAAAAVAVSVTLLLPGQAQGALTLDKGTRSYFAIAGTGSFLANMFRFSALALAPVTIVIPLMRSAFVFTLILNFIFNRHLESFEPRVLGAVAFSMAGAVLLVI